MRTYPGHWAPHLRPDTNPSKCGTSHNPTPTTPPPLSFLSLPRELRDEIYSYLTPPTLSFTMQNQHRTRQMYKSPLEIFSYSYFLVEFPLLLANHQIRSELLSAIYATTTFCFDWRRRSKFILQCLERIPQEATSQIRRLSWRHQSLHTGGVARTVKGWGKVMQHIDAHFVNLRVIHCCLPSGEDGRHRYHNWEIPRLAVGLLVGGRIQEIRWGWEPQIYRLHGVGLEEIFRIAITLMEIPRVEGRDGEMGFEYRRLVGGEGGLGKGKVDRWAVECRGRERYELDVRKVGDCLVVRRKE